MAAFIGRTERGGGEGVNRLADLWTLCTCLTPSETGSRCVNPPSWHAVCQHGGLVYVLYLIVYIYTEHTSHEFEGLQARQRSGCIYWPKYKKTEIFLPAKVSWAHFTLPTPPYMGAWAQCGQVASGTFMCLMDFLNFLQRLPCPLVAHFGINTPRHLTFTR